MFAYLVKAFSFDPFDTTEVFKAARTLRIDRSVGPPPTSGSCLCFSNLIVEVNRTAYDEFGIGNPSGPRSVRMAAKRAEEIVKVRRPLAAELASSSASTSTATPTEDIVSAALQGRAGHLALLEQRQGAASLDNARDSAGNSPAHWAALAGRCPVLRVLGPGRCRTPNSAGQLPLHWACINGHLSAVQLLLDLPGAVADLDARDNRGCTPLIAASQFGQAETAAYLMGRGARLNAADVEGDTALHWAAYLGLPDLVGLLVYSGLSVRQRDSHGQTPLHLACLAGCLSSARALRERHGADPDALDKASRTPIALAVGRRQYEVSDYMHTDLLFRNSGALSPQACLTSIGQRIFGPAGRSRGPAICLLLACLAFALPVYVWRVRPLTSSEFPGVNVAFIVAVLVAAVAHWRCSTVDPGRLPSAPDEYDRAMALAGCLQEQLNNRQRLCHTCRLVRPARAKHCRLCDRCVRDMDHHCPYFDNCVGDGNRHWFTLLTSAGTACGVLGAYLLYQCLLTTGFEYMTSAFMALVCFISLVSLIGSSCAWYHAALNITTNETMNRHRYAYMRDSKGRFRNPFDRGPFANLLEYFHLRARTHYLLLSEGPVEAANGYNGCASSVV